MTAGKLSRFLPFLSQVAVSKRILTQWNIEMYLMQRENH